MVGNNQKQTGKISHNTHENNFKRTTHEVRGAGIPTGYP